MRLWPRKAIEWYKHSLMGCLIGCRKKLKLETTWTVETEIKKLHTGGLLANVSTLQLTSQHDNGIQRKWMCVSPMYIRYTYSVFQCVASSVAAGLAPSDCFMCSWYILSEMQQLAVFWQNIENHRHSVLFRRKHSYLIFKAASTAHSSAGITVMARLST